MAYGAPLGSRADVIQFGWLSNFTSYTFLPELRHFDFGPSNLIELNDFNDPQTDARFLVVSSGVIGPFHDNNNNNTHSIHNTHNTSHIKEHSHHEELMLTFASGYKLTCHFSFVKLQLTTTNKNNNTVDTSHSETHTIHTNTTHANNTHHTQQHKLLMSQSIELRDPTPSLFQKNWIALEHQHKLYFIPRINPWQVLELIQSPTVNNQAELKLVHQADKKVNLPWRVKYGPELRGGTNAIFMKNPYFGNKHIYNSPPTTHITNSNNNTNNNNHTNTNNTHYQVNIEPRHVYLAMFHSRVRVQLPFTFATYFMGAMTLCPTFPFKIHSMTPRPMIMDERLYTGKLWLL